MSYPRYSFMEDTPIGRFPASNIPGVDFDFDNSASSDGSFWESSVVTCHPPEECKECHTYIDHLHTAFPSVPPQQPSFLDGVRIGRRIQREEDSGILSRYRSRLQLAHYKHKESLMLKAKYQAQIELLERELVAVKDRLMAVQLAYEELSMARLDDMPSNSWNSGTSHPWDDADRSSVRSATPPSPAISTADPEDTDVPFVVREATGSGQFPSYYLPDDDDFEVFQQLQMMDEREKDTGAFWNDFRSRNFSVDSGSGLGNSSFESDTESSSSSLSSAPSSTVENVLSDDSDSDFPKSVVETSNGPTAPTAALDITQLSALMLSAHESDNTAALGRVRTLIQDAERTPKTRRSPTQIYLLTNWRNPSRSPSLSPPLPPSALRPAAQSSTPEIFVDASGHGIGLVFNDRWLAWRFPPNHPHIPVGPDKKIIMSWAELIAVELGILTLLANGYRNTRVLIRSDNEGVVTALTKKTWTQSYGLRLILARILRLCEDAPLELNVKWVWTKMNPADGPSRGTYPPADMMLAHAPIIPQYLEGLVRQVEPV